MALAGSFIAMPINKITQQDRMLNFNAHNSRTAVIKSRTISRRDINKGPTGGKTNSIGPLTEENKDSFGNKKSGNGDNNIKGGVGGSQKKTTSTS